MIYAKNASGRFPLGGLHITPGALEAIREAGEEPMDYIRRHARCDFSEMEEHDREANERAIEEGSRVFSAFTIKSGRRIFVITEADRSVTTLLLSEEY